MKITRAHWEFYMFKKMDLPMFQEFTAKARKPSIHDLIPREKERSTCLHNTLATLRIARRQGRLTQVLKDMTTSEGSMDYRKRQAYSKKWLRRIESRAK